MKKLTALVRRMRTTIYNLLEYNDDVRESLISISVLCVLATVMIICLIAFKYCLNG